MIIRQYSVISNIGNKTRCLAVPKTGLGGLPLGFVMVLFDCFCGKIVGKDQRAVGAFEEGACIAIKKRGRKFTNSTESVFHDGAEFFGYFSFSTWRRTIPRFALA